MATAKPRITITLEPEVYQTIQGLAEVQGRSMSSIVSELLTMINPVQQKVLAAVRKAITVQESSKTDLISQLEKGQAQAQSAIGPLIELLDRMGEGEAKPPSGSSRSGAAELPPHSNTGVTNTSEGNNESNKHTGKGRSRASGGSK